ncbi:DUF6440 family protein [Staphylococcus agnetis]|uniref:DUF6440 family protein n=1 Tax=Staphylococcus agnetis TaxID=985762 RepID=UPI0021D03D7B|nr:DUF6440 family protein [Staphylococcus agnetis]UXU56005.1 DUF6440 family protein [Staphylococcus agnetis]
MFKKDTYNRFIVEACGQSKEVACYILTDRETGIQYLSNRAGAGTGITPLLDGNGNVSKVDPQALKSNT